VGYKLWRRQLPIITHLHTDAANYSNIKNEKRNSELKEILIAEINAGSAGYSGGGVGRGQGNVNFHVDYYPMAHQGTLQQKTKPYPMPPPLTSQQQLHLETAAPPLRNGSMLRNDIYGSNLPQSTVMRSQQGTTNEGRMRRNSYHNSFGDGNGWVNTLY